jgi:hypothetical protein
MKINQNRQSLDSVIKKAKMSNGYLIMISIKSGDKINHTFFTNKFPRENISESLDIYRKMLESQINPEKIDSKEELKYKPKILPPEYRK